MSVEANDRELNDFARSLAALVPAASGVHRDELLFRAGQAFARRGRWVWPTTAAALACCAGALGLLQVLQPAPHQVVQTVYLRLEPVDSPGAPSTHLPDGTYLSAVMDRERRPATPSYLALEQFVLRGGIDALPIPATGVSAAPAQKPLSLRELSFE